LPSASLIGATEACASFRNSSELLLRALEESALNVLEEFQLLVEPLALGLDRRRERLLVARDLQDRARLLGEGHAARLDFALQLRDGGRHGLEGSALRRFVAQLLERRVALARHHARLLAHFAELALRLLRALARQRELRCGRCGTQEPSEDAADREAENQDCRYFHLMRAILA